MHVCLFSLFLFCFVLLLLLLLFLVVFVVLFFLFDLAKTDLLAPMTEAHDRSVGVC